MKNIESYENGKLKLIVESSLNFFSFVLYYCNKKIAVFNGKTVHSYEELPDVELRKFIKKTIVKRLKIWRNLLVDRKEFFNTELRKSTYNSLPYDISILELYWFSIYKIILNDVINLDLSIKLKENKALLHENRDIDKLNYLGYEELQRKIDELILIFEKNKAHVHNVVKKKKRDKNGINPKAVVNDPIDQREIFIMNGFPICKENGEYVIENMKAFISRAFYENYIYEDEKVSERKDAFTAEWLYKYVNCVCGLETIKRYIRDCKNRKSGEIR